MPVTTNINRRHFLLGASAAALTAAAPLPALGSQPVIGIDLAGGPSATTVAFAAGPAESFGWRPYFATSLEDAYRQYLESYEPKEVADRLIAEMLAETGLAYDEECVQRCEAWDGRDLSDIKGADWIAAGLGCTCMRCSEETYPECGANIVGEEVVCDECMTLRDYVVVQDHATVVDRLIELLDGSSVDEVRASLAEEGLLEEIEARGLLAQAAESFNE